MRKNKPRGKCSCSHELWNCKMPAAFAHPIRTPTSEKQCSRRHRDWNCADPADQAQVSPTGHPLQDCWEPEPKSIAANVGTESGGREHEHRRTTQRLTDRHPFAVG